MVDIRSICAVAVIPFFLAGAARLCAQSGSGAPVPSPESVVPSLAAAYQAYFPIGAAVAPETIQTQGDLLSVQVNSLVAENAMKWENIHPRRGNDASAYNFYAADAIAAFAKQHGMRLRGHTLVWHQQVPQWVFRGVNDAATRDEVLERMRDHITTVLGRFKGTVAVWDVVNEAVSDGGGTWRTESPWFQAAGADEGGIPGYIVKAFEFARAADPAAKLFYNDYNIEAGEKLEKAFSLVKALKDKGLIDGVGIQGHWSIYGPDAETVRKAIERFASLGVDVEITELDLSVHRWGDSSSLAGLPADLQQKQADHYAALFKVFRDEAAGTGASVGSPRGRLTGVTMWGIADDHTWLDSFPVPGRKDWPLLFDTTHQPKAAFWAVAKW
jgi:endo-1,4-beta-xylanase